VHQVPSRVNQPRDFFWTEHGWQFPGTLGKWNLIEQVWSSKGLDEEEAQSRSPDLDGPGRQLPIPKQMHLVLADMAWAQALRRTMEVLRKVFNRVEIATRGAWRIVATLEFIQHQLPKTGHGKPPVT
jgi:hypothetical protein